MSDNVRYAALAALLAFFIDMLLGVIVVPLVVWIYGLEIHGREPPHVRGAGVVLITDVFPILATLTFWKYRQATREKCCWNEDRRRQYTRSAQHRSDVWPVFRVHRVSDPSILGFFWIGWDARKQGWHDKLAGTS